MGDDNFLEVPVDEGQSDAGSSAISHQGPDFDQAQTEQEQLDAIQQEIDDLIKEDTLPGVLQKFRDFDTNFMMPIFKRPISESKGDVEVEEAEGGKEDDFFQVHDEGDKISMGAN